MGSDFIPDFFDGLTMLATTRNLIPPAVLHKHEAAALRVATVAMPMSRTLFVPNGY